MRENRKEQKITGKTTDSIYSNILFEDLRIDSARLMRIKFDRVHFKRPIVQDSTFIDCEFYKCKFFGIYGSLGFSSKYINCKFIECHFTGVLLFSRVRFYNCSISRVIHNAIIEDLKKTLFRKKVFTFNDCDLSEVLFENLDLHGKGFNNCILPKKGIRKFRNENDELIKRAQKICSEILTQGKIESEVIFKKSWKTGQNPIILDELFLNSFFKTQESKSIFDTIIEGFELP